MKLDKKIFIITGPSAVGKNAIIDELFKTCLPIQRMATMTSRKRRKGDKKDEYHFVSREKFQKYVDDDAMIEWVEYNNNLYGTRKSDLEAIFKAGKHPIMDIDVRGVEFFKKNFDNIVSVFILPSSMSILRKRLEKRGTPEKDIRDRLKTANSEIKQAPKFDYRVINYDGKLKNVTKEVADIVTKEIS